MAEEQLTPMMAQFRDLKKKHPDAVMLFRCGDFYETYQEDAVTAAQVLGITLTHRNNKGAVASVEMAGFPYHALDTYLPRLIRAGYRVAICDQLEDPKLTKKLVKRGVTELVTPGVALTDNVLSQKENNFVAALQMTKGVCGVALLDITTGEFAVAEGTVDYIVKLLGSMAPKEVLIERGSKERFQKAFGTGYFCYELDDWNFAEKNCLDRLHRHFHVRNMKGYGVAHMTAALTAAGSVALGALQGKGIVLGTHILKCAGIRDADFTDPDREKVMDSYYEAIGRDPKAALIKCIEELQMGNSEFSKAKDEILSSLHKSYTSLWSCENLIFFHILFVFIIPQQ